MSPAEHARAVEIAAADLAVDMSQDERFHELAKPVHQAAAEYDGGEGLEMMSVHLLGGLDRCWAEQTIDARLRQLMGLRAKVLAFCDTLRAVPGNSQ